MTHRVFKLTDKAIENGYDWDTAIAEGEIETVEEFDSYTDAVDAYNDRYNDSDVYRVDHVNHTVLTYRLDGEKVKVQYDKHHGKHDC